MKSAHFKIGFVAVLVTSLGPSAFLLISLPLQETASTIHLLGLLGSLITVIMMALNFLHTPDRLLLIKRYLWLGMGMAGFSSGALAAAPFAATRFPVLTIVAAIFSMIMAWTMYRTNLKRLQQLQETCS